MNRDSVLDRVNLIIALRKLETDPDVGDKTDAEIATRIISLLGESTALAIDGATVVHADRQPSYLIGYALQAIRSLRHASKFGEKK